MYRKNITTLHSINSGTVAGGLPLSNASTGDSIFLHVRQIIENAYRTLGVYTKDPLVYRYIAAVRGVCAAIISVTTTEYGGCETLRESNAFSLNALLTEVYLNAGVTENDGEMLLMSIFNSFAALADERDEDSFKKRFETALDMITSKERSCAPSLAYKLSVLWNVFALALPAEKELPLLTGI